MRFLPWEGRGSTKGSESLHIRDAAWDQLNI